MGYLDGEIKTYAGDLQNELVNGFLFELFLDFSNLPQKFLTDKNTKSIETKMVSKSKKENFHNLLDFSIDTNLKHNISGKVNQLKNEKHIYKAPTNLKNNKNQITHKNKKKKLKIINLIERKSTRLKIKKLLKEEQHSLSKNNRLFIKNLSMIKDKSLIKCN